jgi:cyanamide hydratase family protein with HD domain
MTAADFRLNIGKAIHIQQFPEWEFTDETYLLICLLHDIGTTDKNISATLMSFEFYGGQIALDLLHKTHHAPIEQAESIAEAVIRHQDIGNVGTITTIGLLIQLATIFGKLPRCPLGSQYANSTCLQITWEDMRSSSTSTRSRT